jgi:hypothetical protein
MLRAFLERVGLVQPVPPTQAELSQRVFESMPPQIAKHRTTYRIVRGKSFKTSFKRTEV